MLKERRKSLSGRVSLYRDNEHEAHCMKVLPKKLSLLREEAIKCGENMSILRRSNAKNSNDKNNDTLKCRQCRAEHW